MSKYFHFSIIAIGLAVFPFETQAQECFPILEEEKYETSRNRIAYSGECNQTFGGEESGGIVFSSELSNFKIRTHLVQEKGKQNFKIRHLFIDISNLLKDYDLPSGWKAPYVQGPQVHISKIEGGLQVIVAEKLNQNEWIDVKLELYDNLGFHILGQFVADWLDWVDEGPEGLEFSGDLRGHANNCIVSRNFKNQGMFVEFECNVGELDEFSGDMFVPEIYWEKEEKKN